MGLKNVTSLLSNKKRNFPEYKRTGWLSDYSGTRVAIDGHGWMYQYMAASQKHVANTTDLSIDGLNRNESVKEWIVRAITYTQELMSHGITPLFVFDGVSVPEKDGTKKVRRDAKEKTANEIKLLEEEKEKYDQLSMPIDLLQRLQKLYASENKIHWDEIEFLKTTLETIGIPVIQARGESEKLCSLLCIEGICSAVISADSDCYAFGCPVLIKKYGGKKYNSEKGKMDREITVVKLRDLLTSLSFNFQQFVDLAIMSGCDFNKNIAGVGGVGCYDLIKKYGSFSKIDISEFKGKDITTLKYEKCMEIFSVTSYRNEMLSGRFEVKMGDVDMLRDTLESVSAGMLTPGYINVIRALPTPNNRGFNINPFAMKIV